MIGWERIWKMPWGRIGHPPSHPRNTSKTPPSHLQNTSKTPRRRFARPSLKRETLSLSRNPNDIHTRTFTTLQYAFMVPHKLLQNASKLPPTRFRDASFAHSPLRVARARPSGDDDINYAIVILSPKTIRDAPRTRSGLRHDSYAQSVAIGNTINGAVK